MTDWRSSDQPSRKCGDQSRQDAYTGCIAGLTGVKVIKSLGLVSCMHYGTTEQRTS
jgi:hypothetical protein